MTEIEALKLVISVGGLGYGAIIATRRHRETKRLLNAILDQGRRVSGHPVIVWPIRVWHEVSRVVQGPRQPKEGRPQRPPSVKPSWFPGYPSHPPSVHPSIEDDPSHYPPRPHPGRPGGYPPPSSRPDYQTRPVDPRTIITRDWE